MQRTVQQVEDFTADKPVGTVINKKRENMFNEISWTNITPIIAINATML